MIVIPTCEQHGILNIFRMQDPLQDPISNLHNLISPIQELDQVPTLIYMQDPYQNPNRIPDPDVDHNPIQDLIQDPNPIQNPSESYRILKDLTGS